MFRIPPEEKIVEAASGTHITVKPLFLSMLAVAEIAVVLPIKWVNFEPQISTQNPKISKFLFIKLSTLNKINHAKTAKTS